MKNKIIFIQLILLIILPNITSARGSEVTIFRKEGGTVKGELVFVRDSSILIEFGTEEQEIGFDEIEEKIYVIKYNEIDKIVIEGKSYFLLGVLAGASIATYIVINDVFEDKSGPYYSHYRDSAISVGDIICILFGGLIGGMIGELLSPGAVIIKPSENTYQKLKSYARYKGREPEYLKKYK